MQRVIVSTLMQCWDCCHVQSYAKAQACEECGGPVELLESTDTGGVSVPCPIDIREYARRGVNILKVLAGSEEARYYPKEPDVETPKPVWKGEKKEMTGWVRVEYEQIIAATEKAVLIEVDGEEIWMPTSQIDADYSNLVGEGPGHMYVTEWIAKEKDLY